MVYCFMQVSRDLQDATTPSGVVRMPVVKVGRKKYYVDERLKQLRNVRNPHDYAGL